jgi:hypothetical protein
MSKRHEQQSQFVDIIIASLAHVLDNMGALASMRLRTRIVRDRSMSDKSVGPANLNWNALWADCDRLFRIVILAMTKSQVSVDTFSIFDQSFGKVQVSYNSQTVIDVRCIMCYMHDFPSYALWVSSQ